MIVVVLLLLHHVIAELPKQTNYVVKKFDSCPNVGYFFKREENAVTPTCYLCFCQDSGEATCWPRVNKRCDVETYHHLGEKNDTRVRRSPNPIAAGLSDIFFRDATRDLFNKQIPAQCEPFQASYSVGCPPADWCIGCTVCDCDANGHWDCHVLSFCDKDGPGQPPKDLKFPTKHRTRRRSYVPNNPSKKKYITKPTRRPQPTKLPTKPKSKLRSKKSQPAKKKPVPAKKTAQAKKRPTPTRAPKKAPTKKQPQRRNQPKKLPPKKQTKPGKRPWAHDKKKHTSPTTRRKRKLEATLSTMEATRQILNDDDFKKSLKLKISESVMNQFKSALQGAVLNNNKGKKKDKRSIVKKVIIMNAIDSNETMSDDGPKNDTWLENFDVNGGLMKDSNVVKVYPRYKRNVDGKERESTNDSHITESPPILKQKLENITNNTPLIIDKENYFNYAVENGTQNLTIREDHYNLHSDVDNITTTKEFLAKEQKLTVLQLIDTNNKNASDNAYHIITTAIDKETATNETLNTISLTKYITVPMVNHVINNTEIEQSLGSVEDKIIEANNLKFNNWSRIKSENQINQMVAEANEKKDKKVLRTSDIERKVSTPKKFKLKKLVRMSPKPNKQNTSETPDSGLTYVKDFINKFLVTTTNKKSKKANNVVKYLQRYFRKLFVKSKNKKKSNGTRIKTPAFQKHLQTLCETFGPCHLDPEQELKLQSKVELLNRETYKMLRGIKIIHGLLKLVDIAGNDKDLKGDSVKTSIYFKDDIKKLQAILTNNYLNKTNKDRLTSTQLAQIDYIKKNAFQFMASAGKFAGILNDVINVIQTPAVIIKNTSKQRTSRYAESNKDEQFDKLKQILDRFNLVQNSFIQKIYKLISTKSTAIEDRKLPRQDEILNAMNAITNEKEIKNGSDYINIYTQNIITNLRKLKNLAKKFESRSVRRKRDLKDDEALEYLLMLMEYMMKQKRHLDSAPVNDGIDLLIEAIKHAPDIKPIRKKVLLNTPKSASMLTTTEYLELITIRDDSSSNLNTNSKEENITSQLNDLGKIAQSMDYSDNEIERDNLDKKDFFDGNTDMDYYKKDDLAKATFIESSTESPIALLKENTERNEATKQLEKIYTSHEREDHGRKMGSYNAEEEENTTGEPITTGVYCETTSEADYKTEINGLTTEFNVNDIKMRHFNNNDMNNEANEVNNIDRKKGIDWVDANYGDINDDQNKTEVTRYKSETTTSSTTEMPPNENYSNEVRKDKKKWYHPEDVVYKKEMNLLNSLDYTVGGYKETKEEESNSKEGTEDKISAEAVGY